MFLQRKFRGAPLCQPHFALQVLARSGNYTLCNARSSVPFRLLTSALYEMRMQSVKKVILLL